MGKMIKSYDPDILSTQEGLKWQVSDLEERLPDWEYYGVGRESGKTKGEYVAIFFKKDKFDLLDKGTFWLSETPDEVSKGWDAAEYRIASWVILKEKATGKVFAVLNTHYDNRGRNAIFQSSLLIAERLKTIAKDIPVIVTGDFNGIPNGLMQAGLRDSRQISQ